MKTELDCPKIVYPLFYTSDKAVNHKLEEKFADYCHLIGTRRENAQVIIILLRYDFRYF